MKDDVPLNKSWKQDAVELCGCPCVLTTAQIEEQRHSLIWNARLRETRAPEVIAQPRTAQEVAAFVRFARQVDLKISLRGSGHNYQGAALRDGGAMIDLGKLNSVSIVPAERRARIGAGVTGGDLIRQLSQYDLAFPVGHCGDVAVSGYLLSGGFGWNYGEWGPACQHVTAVQMVTADGNLIRVDNTQHPDLFWAAKGAGAAFFAAVTAYEIRLQPLPATAFVQETVFAASDASIVAQWMREADKSVDETVELICLVGPDPEQGQPSVTLRAISSGASVDAARKKMGELRSFPKDVPLLHPAKTQTVPFSDLSRFSALPADRRVAADHIWSEASLPDLLLAVAHLADGPQTTSAISLTALGNGARPPCVTLSGDTCLSVGGASGAGVYALWEGAENDAVHLAWVRAAEAALRPFKCGRYVGEADLFCDSDRLADCFSHDALLRLRALRRKYDPSHLFLSVLN